MVNIGDVYVYPLNPRFIYRIIGLPKQGSKTYSIEYYRRNDHYCGAYVEADDIEESLLVSQEEWMLTVMKGSYR